MAYADSIKPPRTTRDETTAITKRAGVVPLVNITTDDAAIFLLRNLKQMNLTCVYSKFLLRTNVSMMYCY